MHATLHAGVYGTLQMQTKREVWAGRTTCLAEFNTRCSPALCVSVFRPYCTEVMEHFMQRLTMPSADNTSALTNKQLAPYSQPTEKVPVIHIHTISQTIFSRSQYLHATAARSRVDTPSTPPPPPAALSLPR